MKLLIAGGATNVKKPEPKVSALEVYQLSIMSIF